MNYTHKYIQKIRDKIVGSKIVDLGVSDDGMEMPAIILDNGDILWIQRDPEGNGPGCISYQKGGE